MSGLTRLLRPLAGLAAIAALLALSAAGCDSAPPADSSDSPPPMVSLIHQDQGADLLQLPRGGVPGMTETTLAAVDLPGVLETTGQITFDDRRVANIISRVTGRIEEVRVSQWDNVQRGQPILTLYSPDFMTAEAEYLQAKAAGPALAPGGADSDQFARSMLEAARRKLDLLGISPAQIESIWTAAPSFVMRAPISGTIVQNQALRGSAVNPGDVLYSVGTLDDVWVVADIYEDELARVRVGQQLEAVATAYPSETFYGTIARISPGVDPNTHTIQIRCEVKNPGLKLKPQMLAVVKILVQPGHALVVPVDALVFETDAYMAYVDTGNGRIEQRKVAIASWNQPGFARVVSGLTAGDRVITGESLQVDQLWNRAHGAKS
ncbi:MAG TPA: efflux RND transporter periplasmic adaptor subunit [Candidatus Binataceae bacterium]|nr:efflux RND transporter periplasmic adaptor subunit [Candidatus Binataceae bacterium]